MSRVSPSHISRKLFVLFVPLALAIWAIAATTGAASSHNQALINASTVSGSPSLEEQAAVAAGFDVTVVSDATWGTMTAAQFGAYELLIAGDPFCGDLPPGLVASAPVWGPVVLGTAGGRTQAGNRIIIGTDPVLHQGGGLVLITEGMAYAGLQPGRTGMYLDVTCAADYYGQSAETLTLVNAISSPTASGIWTIDADPPCGGSVSLIAEVPGSFPTLTTADLQGWSCSVHEAFPTFKSDFAALAIATDTLTKPTCGVDTTSGLPACGEAYILIAGSGIVIVSGSISLAPLDDTNPVGTNHTVTATVTDASGPLANQLVTFEVTGVNAGAVGTCSPLTCTTDASGNVSFTYNGAAGPGDDTIKASFTDAAGSLQSATAQKHWAGVVVGPPATLELTPEADTNPVGTEHCVTATVEDASGNPTPNITVNFTVSGANATAGAGVTDANGVATFCYVGTVAGLDNITATAVGGTNPSDTATKTWTTGQPATLALTPETDTNTVDDQHCVTATVRDQFGNPTPNVVVRFSVAGSVTTSGSATTDAAGQAQFCYTGPGLPGADTITAYADTDNDNVNDAAPADPEDTATKTWLIPANNVGCKVTNGGWIITTAGNRANFGGNAKGDGPKGNENYQDHGLGMHVKSTEILAVTCSTDGTSASIFGTAKIAGVSGTWDFRIDVRDLGEPGRDDRYRIRLSNGYDSGDQQLSGGNIQIH